MRKNLTAKVEKDVRNIGQTLQRLGEKLLGDATAVALDATDRTLAAAQKKLQKVRAQLKRPAV